MMISLVADSSDAGSEGGEITRKRRRGMDEDVEEDPLDRMEATLKEQEHQERKKKHRRTADIKDGDGGHELDRTGDSDGGEDEEMDVESEEEEEDIKVRRTGTGARKKRAIDFGKEEEE